MLSHTLRGQCRWVSCSHCLDVVLTYVYANASFAFSVTLAYCFSLFFLECKISTLSSRINPLYLRKNQCVFLFRDSTTLGFRVVIVKSYKSVSSSSDSPTSYPGKRYIHFYLGYTGLQAMMWYILGFAHPASWQEYCSGRQNAIVKVDENEDMRPSQIERWYNHVY